MSIFQRAKSRLNEMREEDRKKSQERRNQRHYEETVETMKRGELEAKRKSAYEQGYEKGTVERARHEGRQKAMRKSGLGFSVEGFVGGLETGGRMIGTFGENVSIGLTGESPRRRSAKKRKTKRKTIGHRKARQQNSWLW